jgi:hypothetical protein
VGGSDVTEGRGLERDIMTLPFPALLLSCHDASSFAPAGAPAMRCCVTTAQKQWASPPWTATSSTVSQEGSFLLQVETQVFVTVRES